MIVERKQVFNLKDTNGRRSNVLNALKVYVEVLEELKEAYPTESWGIYPSSLSKFLFYEKALEKSKDVFKIHRNYDSFISDLGKNYQTFTEKKGKWIKNNISKFAKIKEVFTFLETNAYYKNIINTIKNSFAKVPQITDIKWHQEIMSNIIN